MKNHAKLTRPINKLSELLKYWTLNDNRENILKKISADPIHVCKQLQIFFKKIKLVVVPLFKKLLVVVHIIKPGLPSEKLQNEKSIRSRTVKQQNSIYRIYARSCMIHLHERSPTVYGLFNKTGLSTIALPPYICKNHRKRKFEIVKTMIPN